VDAATIVATHLPVPLPLVLSLVPASLVTAFHAFRPLRFGRRCTGPMSLSAPSLSCCYRLCVRECVQSLLPLSFGGLRSASAGLGGGIVHKLSDVVPQTVTLGMAVPPLDLSARHHTSLLACILLRLRRLPAFLPLPLSRVLASAPFSTRSR
jgi:hypothetical protein